MADVGCGDGGSCSPLKKKLRGAELTAEEEVGEEEEEALGEEAQEEVREEEEEPRAGGPDAGSCSPG